MSQVPTATPTAPVPITTPGVPAETSLSWLIPVVNGKALVDYTTKSDFRFATVHGTFTVASVLTSKGGVAVPAPAGTMVRILVDDLPASSPAPLGTTVTIDSTRWPDGTHAIAIDVVDAGPGGERLSPRCIPFAVDNVPVVPRNADSQRVPMASLVYHQMTFSPRVAWMQYQGRVPFPPSIPLAAPVGVPVVVAPDLLRLPQYWTGVSLTRANSGLYRPSLHVYTSGDGHVFTAPHYPRGGASSEAQRPQNDAMDWWTGDRGAGDVSPYSSFIADPRGSGWVGVDISGSVFTLGVNGKVKALWGPWNRRRWERSCVSCHTNTTPKPPGHDDPTMPPRWWHDATATPAQRLADKEWLGTFDVRPNVVNDLALDPSDPDLIYLADTWNHRIARLDLRGTKESLVQKGVGHGRVTTYAGGTAGYLDGQISSARFNKPTSLAIDRGRMWIADRDNCALRVIDMATGEVTTASGGHMATSSRPVESMTRPHIYPAMPAPPQTTADWIRFPQCVRVDSAGTPIVSENLTKSVKAIDTVSGTVTFIATSPGDLVSANNPWTWIEVDRAGLCGPRDDVLDAWISGRSNAYIGRHSRDGTWHGTLAAGKKDRRGGAQELNEPDFPGRHYPWAVSIDLQGNILTTGFGTSGVGMLRRRVPGDLVHEDGAAFQAGALIHRLGTVPAFGMAVRPSFAMMHGTYGMSSVGGQSFDEAAAWWVATQSMAGPAACLTVGALELQRGWGDGVARPEITGIDAWNYAYFVLRCSDVRGWTMPPKPVATGPGPAIAGVTITRGVAAGTAGVVVTWTTNVPTLGLARYGRGAAPIGRSWDAEDGFSTQHTQQIQDVPAGPLMWWVTARDDFGRTTIVTIQG